MESKRKKILYVITKSNFGGAQRYVFELATNLPKEQYEPIVAFGGAGALKEKLETSGICTRNIKSFERDINLIKELRSMKELYDLTQKERPDIVHLNSSKAGGSGAFIARLCGVKKIIFTAHGWPFFEDRGFMWKSIVWFFSWLTAILAHEVILVSNHDLENAHLPFVQKKYTVIHTAVPHIDFQDEAMARENLFPEADVRLHEKDMWLVTNAELNRNKNLFFAIDVVAEWNRSNEQKIFYSIISDGELKESLAAHIRKNNADGQIRLLGYLSDARKYLKAFDVFLLPSKKEGMPYSLLEAGAAGLAVIASRVGGIPELISHNENGLLINPENKESLRNAVSSVIEQPILRETYGTKLQERVLKEFSLTQMLAETRALYEENGSRAS